MGNIHKIIGNPEGFEHLDVFHKLAKQFLPYAQEKLQFDKPVDVQLVSDLENAKDPLGKTAYYDPNNMKITLFVDNRHVKDIMRSLAHELVHHKQNCRGDFAGEINTGPGYAQEDGKMRKLEGEAYLEGSGYLFRDWEDNLKKENKVMAEVKNPGKYKTGMKAGYDTDGDGVPDGADKDAKDGAIQEEEQTKEETVDEGKDKPCPKCKKVKCEAHCPGAGKRDDQEDIDESHCPGKRDDEKEETNENWFKGNKDQLLFERLVQKWTK